MNHDRRQVLKLGLAGRIATLPGCATRGAATSGCAARDLELARFPADGRPRAATLVIRREDGGLIGT